MSQRCFLNAWHFEQVVYYRYMIFLPNGRVRYAMVYQHPDEVLQKVFRVSSRWWSMTTW